MIKHISHFKVRVSGSSVCSEQMVSSELKDIGYLVAFNILIPFCQILFRTMTLGSKLFNNILHNLTVP